jgi:hypothetical protein
LSKSHGQTDREKETGKASNDTERPHAGFQPGESRGRSDEAPRARGGYLLRHAQHEGEGKFLLRVREPDILAIACSLEEKEFLMQNAPKIYFETDHYKGWPYILIRLSKIKDDELAHRIAVAWRLHAPKKLQTEAATPSRRGKHP